MKTLDPYDVPLMLATLNDAQEYLKKKNSVPAVIVARRECLLLSRGKGQQLIEPIDLEEDCTGCKTCVTRFGCPALLFDDHQKKVKIDDSLCIECGICLYACPRHEKGKSIVKFRGKRITAGAS
jgi:indolepyruvate ferredoxin oxidoreductase alpha subunit